MILRPATDDDAPFIEALTPRFAECELPPWRTRDEIVRGTAGQLANALSGNGGEHSLLLVAEQSGERLGFAWVLLHRDFYTGEPIGKISEIATVRNGTGAGRALMLACEAYARERGARLMTLNVLEGNERARRFYAECGYAPEYSMFAKPLD